MTDKKPMTRCERGVWIDTEGHITIKEIKIPQKESEKAVLEEYCESARKDGVPCRILRLRTLRQYAVQITGYPNVAREITLTKDCIRTKTKHRQIERFKQALEVPRITHKKIVKKALEILKA